MTQPTYQNDICAMSRSQLFCTYWLWPSFYKDIKDTEVKSNSDSSILPGLVANPVYRLQWGLGSPLQGVNTGKQFRVGYRVFTRFVCNKLSDLINERYEGVIRPRGQC